MYCENENSCKECNNGFSLFDGQCLPSIDLQNNLKCFTPDNGTHYYTCSLKVSNWNKCSYDDFLFNKFHCSQCSNGLKLIKTNECESEQSTNNSGKFLGSVISFSLALLHLIFI